jgi:hypothetical protein
VTDDICQSTASGGVVEFVYFLIILVYYIMVVMESYLFCTILHSLQREAISPRYFGSMSQEERNVGNTESGIL